MGREYKIDGDTAIFEGELQIKGAQLNGDGDLELTFPDRTVEVIVGVTRLQATGAIKMGGIKFGNIVNLKR